MPSVHSTATISYILVHDNYTMNEKDRKEIEAFDSYLQHIKDECESHAKKGIIYGNASYTDMDLCADEVERRLDNNEDFAEFIPEMIKEGYELSVFGVEESDYEV